MPCCMFVAFLLSRCDSRSCLISALCCLCLIKVRKWTENGLRKVFALITFGTKLAAAMHMQLCKFVCDSPKSMCRTEQLVRHTPTHTSWIQNGHAKTFLSPFSVHLRTLRPIWQICLIFATYLLSHVIVSNIQFLLYFYRYIISAKHAKT